MFNKAELKLFYRIIGSNFRAASFPAKLGFITTYRCNLKCQMCKIWEKNPVNELSYEEIEKFFRISNKFSWVGITGGEPFLREDILQIARAVTAYCKDLCVIHFATNGTLTDRILNTVDSLIKHNHSKVKILLSISIDGLKSEHDKIRGMPGCWDKSVQTFLELKKIPQVQPRICMTLSNYNFDAFEDIFLSIKERLPSFKFDDLGVNIFHKSEFYYANEDVPSLDRERVLLSIDKILRLDKECFSYNNFIRRLYLKAYKHYSKYQKPLFNCQALSFNCVMDPCGDIYPCGIFNMKVGNVKDFQFNLQHLWQSNQVARVRERCFQHNCPKCWSPCDAYSSIICGLIKKFPSIIRLLSR